MMGHSHQQKITKREFKLWHSTSTTTELKNILDKHNFDSLPDKSKINVLLNELDVSLERHYVKTFSATDIYSERMIRAHVNRGAGMQFPRIDKLEDFASLLGTSIGSIPE